VGRGRCIVFCYGNRDQKYPVVGPGADGSLVINVDSVKLDVLAGLAGCGHSIELQAIVKVLHAGADVGCLEIFAATAVDPVGAMHPENDGGGLLIGRSHFSSSVAVGLCRMEWIPRIMSATRHAARMAAGVRDANSTDILAARQAARA
jgi:hypothetical protein